MTKEEAIKVLNTYDVNFDEYTAEEIADAIDMAIEALQTDAVSRKDTVTLNSPISIQSEMVSVVRCKDCIHWKADNEVFELGFCCVFPQKWVAETFYCADGERREPDECE